MVKIWEIKHGKVVWDSSSSLSIKVSSAWRTPSRKSSIESSLRISKLKLAIQPSTKKWEINTLGSVSDSKSWSRERPRQTEGSKIKLLMTLTKVELFKTTSSRTLLHSKQRSNRPRQRWKTASTPWSKMLNCSLLISNSKQIWAQHLFLQRQMSALTLRPTCSHLCN